jgi:hypothetical protein
VEGIPQNGLPASLKAKQKNRLEYQNESNAEDKDQKTVEDLIIERLIEEDAEEESEGPEVPETKNKPISADLLEKINSLHYELEWSAKRMNEIEWNYCFPELDTAEFGRVNLPEMPKREMDLKNWKKRLNPLLERQGRPSSGFSHMSPREDTLRSWDCVLERFRLSRPS